MSKLKPVRGTHDLFGDSLARHNHVLDTARALTSRFRFEQIVTPIFEATEVFARSLGETSDVVTKEMYTFDTKGGESITLRPEGTAGVARAFISNGMAQSLPLKLFYAGPMFRYERPQKGRQRQFHQIGVELLGVDTPQADVEVIAMAGQLLGELGVAGNITLELNTLGDGESRNAWRAALVEYFTQYAAELSEDSQMRLEKNPLRILDSKNSRDQEIAADAPAFEAFLNDDSRVFFESVQAGLANLGVSFTLNPHIVRGLDYYSHTAFEFTTDALGAQGTVLAGGRYDGLIAQMGGPATTGVGWAAGVERLSMLLDPPAMKADVLAVIPAGAEAQAAAEKLVHGLRQAGFTVDLGYSGNMKKRFKRADQVGASLALILGEEELSAGLVTVRDMASGEQQQVAPAGLREILAARGGSRR